jgi:diaminohydroxyphosphoribosylaminopyrimidine deaminase/5-amino-6-(5-phosphoribosylamino)uracil reductase
MNDIDYMKRAFELAERGKGHTSPNPMVGAIVVKDGKIIGGSWHKRCGGPHAEIAALQRAGGRAKGAKLYVTLEPCFHFGRTPPCVDAVISAGIKEVIIGMKDPNPLTNGKSIAKLRRAGIKVKVGILQKELEGLNEAFVKYITRKMPFVVAKSAQTLDGKIAPASGGSKWITSKKTRAFSRRLRNDFDAILVGINTVLKDDPGLNAPRKSKRLKKIILDSRLRIPPTAKLFKNTLPADCLIATTTKAGSEKIDRFRKRGIQVIVCPQKNGGVDLKWLFKELAKREIANLLIEGGAHVIGSALNAKLVDKRHIFVAPKIMGDKNALDAAYGFKGSRLAQAVKLKEVTVQRIGGDIFVEGTVVYKS